MGAASIIDEGKRPTVRLPRMDGHICIYAHTHLPPTFGKHDPHAPFLL